MAVTARPNGALPELVAMLLRKVKALKLPMRQAVFVVGEVLTPLMAQYLIDHRGSPEARARLDAYLLDLRTDVYARAGYLPPGPATTHTHRILES